MTIQYFIDSENVGDFWIPLLDLPAQETELIVFYTRNSPHMSYDSLIRLKESDRTVTFIKCYEGTNALDFQLVSELGYQISRHEDGRFVIVTNDTGFDAAVKYWRRRKKPVKRITGKECKNLERRLREDLGTGMLQARSASVSARIYTDVKPEAQQDEERDLQAGSAGQASAAENEARPSRPNLRDAERAAQPDPDDAFSVEDSSYMPETDMDDADMDDADMDDASMEDESVDDMSMEDGSVDEADMEDADEFAFDHDDEDMDDMDEAAYDAEEDDFSDDTEYDFEAEEGADDAEEMIEDTQDADQDEESLVQSDTYAEESPEEARADSEQNDVSEEDSDLTEDSDQSFVSDDSDQSFVSDDSDQSFVSDDSVFSDDDVQASERNDGLDVAGEYPEEEENEADNDGRTIAEVNPAPSAGDEAAASGDQIPVTEEIAEQAKDESVIQSASIESASDAEVSGDIAGPADQTQLLDESWFGTEEDPDALNGDQSAESAHRSRSRRSRSRRSKSTSRKQEQPSAAAESEETVKAESPEKAKTGRGSRTAKSAASAKNDAGQSETAKELAESGKENASDALLPPGDEEIARIVACIGAENLAELHNQLATIYGDQGKDIYLSIKNNSRSISVLKPDLRQKFEYYCEIIFHRSDYAGEYPSDISEFLLSVREKLNNLNSLRYALQKHYGKEKGRRFYFLLKPFAKTMYQM